MVVGGWAIFIWWLANPKKNKLFIFHIMIFPPTVANDGFDPFKIPWWGASMLVITDTFPPVAPWGMRRKLSWALPSFLGDVGKMAGNIAIHGFLRCEQKPLVFTLLPRIMEVVNGMKWLPQDLFPLRGHFPLNHDYERPGRNHQAIMGSWKKI